MWGYTLSRRLPTDRISRYHVDMSQVISEIRPSTRNPARASILVDGKWVVSLTHVQVAELGLQAGMPWNDRLLAKISHTKAYDKAMKSAMNRLNRRPMSRRQLQDKLLEKGHDPAIVTQVLDKVQAIGALNEDTYAQALAREYTLHRHAGPAMLRMKLRAKGIDRQVIDRIVAEFEQSDVQFEQALRLAKKKVRSMKRLDGPTRKRRLWGALARRGYGRDAIEAAMQQVLQDHDDDDYGMA
jgi:regulatory protein